MKKLILSVLFILSISPLLAMVGTNVPIKADDVIIKPPVVDSDTLTQEQIDNLTNTSLLLEYLSQGGSIDYSNTSSGYTCEDLLDDFGDFVKDVLNGNDTGIPIIDFVNPFQTSTQYYGLQPVRQAKNAVTSFLGMLPLVYGLQGGDDTPTPNPDINYQSYIDTINGTGFYFKEYPASNSNINYGSVDLFPFYNYSFCATNNQNTNGFSGDFPQMYISNIFDVNIFSNGTQYSIDLTVTFLQPVGTRNGQYMYFFAPYKNPTNGNYYVLFNGSHASDIRFQYTGTLEGCFQYLAYKFRNINIYVNGDLWAYVGGNSQPNYSLDISTGTAVATNDYGYVHWVYDYEIFFRIDRIWDMLTDLLNRPSPQPITWEDFQTLIYDVDGNPAVGVKILQDEDNIDDYLVKHFGTLIPVFPVTVSFPVSAETVASLITIPASVIPSDLMEILEFIFLGTLMVCLLQRLLE